MYHTRPLLGDVGLKQSTAIEIDKIIDIAIEIIKIILLGLKKS